MNRRDFFIQLASGLIVASAPTIFLPQLIKPAWKSQRYIHCGHFYRYGFAEVFELGEVYLDRLTKHTVNHPLPNPFRYDIAGAETWFQSKVTFPILDGSAPLILNSCWEI